MGRSLLEMLWEELDSKLDALMADGEPEQPRFPQMTAEMQERTEEFAEWGRQQGRCEGLAYAIAIITSPYEPNVPAIKEEAMQRWQSTNVSGTADGLTGSAHIKSSLPMRTRKQSR